MQERVYIVHRFAHPHEDDVCQLIDLGHGEDLVEDFARREVGSEALLARHAEEAIHLAASLGRDAERGAVSLGDHDGLNEASTSGKEILDRAVSRSLLKMRRSAPYLVVRGEQCARFLAQVRHLVPRGDMLLVEPVSDLPTRVLGQSQADG